MAKPRTTTPRQRKPQHQAARQYGGRVRIFRGQALQRGHGLGGLFKTLFRVAMPIVRRAVPIVKRVAVQAAKRGTKAGVRVLKDVASKRSTLKGAVKQRAQEAALEAAMDAINKSGASRSTNTTARKRKSKVTAAAAGHRKKTKAPRL